MNALYQHRPSRTIGALTEAPRATLEFGLNQSLSSETSWLLESYYSRQTASSPEDSLRVDTGLAVALGDSVRSKVGGGLGLLQGIGTPRYQFFLSLEFMPSNGSAEKPRAPKVETKIQAAALEEPPITIGVRDADADGLSDVIDQCPLLAEDKDNFRDDDGCPDPDNDFDGYADAEDQSPSEPEDYDGFEDHDGIPEPDNDQDGLSDGADQCPKHPGLGDGCPESTFDWRDYVARTDRSLPAILKSGDVLHLFRVADNADHDDMLIEKAAEWLQQNHAWSRVNLVVSYCIGSDADKVKRAYSLAQKLSGDLTELGISKKRIGFLSMSRYRTPHDLCLLDVRIKRLRSFEGLGNRLDDLPLSQVNIDQEILPVTFLANSADPSATAARVLIKFVQRMKRVNQSFEIQVHTDALGDPEQKLTLSKQRASKLSELLEYLGLPKDQFQCVGKGGAEPIGDNRTLDGRRRNNRVIVLFSDAVEDQL